MQQCVLCHSAVMIFMVAFSLRGGECPISEKACHLLLKGESGCQGAADGVRRCQIAIEEAVLRVTNRAVLRMLVCNVIKGDSALGALYLQCPLQFTAMCWGVLEVQRTSMMGRKC